MAKSILNKSSTSFSRSIDSREKNNNTNPRGKPRGFEEVLDKEQKETIKHEEGPLLVIAGAGTGKTTVITERIKYLILEKKVSPSEILALTFTEKAAKEMEERVDIAMPYGYTQMWISTFHAFCDRVLRSEAIHIGLNPAYRLLTEAEAIMLLRKHLFQFELDYFRPLGNPTKFLEGMLQHFNRLKDEDVSPSEYIAWAQTQNSNKKLNAKRNTLDADKEEVRKTNELANAYKTYGELKNKEGVMDFGDLISNTLRLFRERKNILKNYQEKFRYILVDEFQDTNFAQNTLAVMLAGEQKNLTVVGDDDQAIYRWRGAAISNIIQFREQFPTTKIVSLTKNYRSTQEILDKTYTLIQYNNPDRLEVKENINKKLVSQRRTKGQPVQLLFADRVENEAELVAKTIQKLIAKKSYNYGQIAVLVRANDHSSSFSRAFSRHTIPFQFLGPGRLFHQEEVRNLISYLKVLYNFEDTPSLYRVLHMPIFEFEARDIAALLNWARRKNQTLFEVLENLLENNEIFIKEEARKNLSSTAAMIKRHLKRVPKDSAGQILYYFLEETGMLRKMLASQNQTEEKQYQNIARFFDKLKTFEVEHEDASVFAVVEWIDLALQMGESPLATDTDWSQENAVNILTVHSSKGLEFPIVFIVNLVTQRFPTRQRSEKIPIPEDLIKEILPSGDFHLQEERRLFYVAATRARDHLFFTAANFYGEGKRERKLSPFVYETLGQDETERSLSQNKKGQALIQESLLDWASGHLPKTKDQRPASPAGRPTTKVTYLSYSQIQTFDICPLHYKLKYILKIPTPQSSALSFGTSVHSSLRDFYLMWIRGEKTPIAHIQKIIEKNWINEGYESKQHEEIAKKRALFVITEYLRKNFKEASLPLAVELPFQFYIEKLKVGGRIDRIDRIDDNTIEIIDYKTGINIPTERELANNLQLTFYALCASEVRDRILNRKPEQVLLSLYYLEEDKKVTTTRTKEQLEEAKKLILEKAAEIEKSDFSCSRSTLCANCEYKILCSTIA